MPLVTQLAAQQVSGMDAPPGEQPPNFNLFTGLVLPWLPEIGMEMSTRSLLGGRLDHIRQGRGRIGGFFQARREGYRESQALWKAMRGPGTFGERWHRAMELAGKGATRRVAGPLAQRQLSGMALKRVATTRLVAGLARAPLGVANAYFWLGSLLPAAAEAAVAGMGALQKFGASLRKGTPETSVGYRDFATQERAFTMRQSSLMAIHMSRMGSRAALGNEAQFLHG